jgi:hypothetical protein
MINLLKSWAAVSLSDILCSMSYLALTSGSEVWDLQKPVFINPVLFRASIFTLKGTVTEWCNTFVTYLTTLCHLLWLYGCNEKLKDDSEQWVRMWLWPTGWQYPFICLWPLR